MGVVYFNDCQDKLFIIGIRKPLNKLDGLRKTLMCLVHYRGPNIRRPTYTLYDPTRDFSV